MGRFPLGIAFVGVCASIASFVALAVERRGSGWPMAAQIAAGTVSVAFVIVALVKLYSTSPHIAFGFVRAEEWSAEATAIGLASLTFGLTGVRVRSSAPTLGVPVAACAALGCAAYAISLESDFFAYVWWSVAATMAFLSGSAAARMRRRQDASLRLSAGEETG